MKLTNIHLDKISAEVVEITKSFEFIQNKLDEAMKDLTEDLLDPNLVPDKLIELKEIIFELMELLNKQMKLRKNVRESHGSN